MAASAGRVNAEADPAATDARDQADPAATDAREQAAPVGEGAATRGDQAAAGDERGAARSLADLLQHPRFEILPLDGIEEQVREHVPTEVKVTVTASPRKGLEATLDLTERLSAAGYTVVPHLSARLVRDRAHLEEVLAGLEAAGITELFVPAGDATEPGEFQGAADLLAAMGEARTHFERIGITGYPESHHLISDEETIRAMFAKSEMATDIISQLCFDPATIGWWIGAVRARGTQLPIWIGIPGAVNYAKLVRISMKIGVAESARYLRHQHGWASRLMTRQFKPDRLLDDLAQVVTEPDANVGGFHIYTFNDVARTERWRRRTLDRLATRRAR
jgi:methylenetetrahydrofolate reductase (NADPH)